MRLFFTFKKVLVLAVFYFLANAAAAQSRLADSLALVALYNNTTGASWTTKTNWLSAQPINTWYGVTVSNGRLSALNLPSNNLTGGPLPNGLVIDSALVTLNLSNNSIGGNLPFFSDTSLVTLNLSNNQFFGSLNYFALKNLQTLDLSNNQFNGDAASLSSYVKLQNLNVSHNQFATGLPSFFGSGTILSVNLSYNQFAGNLPYFSSASLTTLDLSNNLLSGGINYWALAALQNLNLSNNQLNGGAGALSSFSNALSIDVSYNQFSGAAPYFGGKDLLVSLNLSHNQLNASLPYFTNAVLQTIDLSYNLFTGTIGYYNTPVLVNFRIDHNQLTGVLNFNAPATLKVFTANVNKLSGNIVPALSSLTTLKIDSNKYTFAQVEAKAALPANPLTYGGQDTLLPLTYNLYIPGKLSVSAGGTLTNNTYKWFNGVVLAATTVGDSTFAPVAPGSYTVVVTNAIATQLTLTSNVAVVSQILPVNLLSFSGKLSVVNGEQVANLVWQTASEFNNNRFEIEKSSDGVTFTKTGSVLSLAPQGNSSVAINYAFSDYLKQDKGTIYYRLKQVDADNKFQYSKILSLQVEKSPVAGISVLLYPNPAVANIAVQLVSLEAKRLVINLRNFSGSLLQTRNVSVQAGSQVFSLNVSGYASGTCFVELRDMDNQLIGYQKIVKQ